MGLIENRATHKLMYDHDIDHWMCEGVLESRIAIRLFQADNPGSINLSLSIGPNSDKLLSNLVPPCELTLVYKLINLRLT